MILIFGVSMQLDLNWSGIVGQGVGQRSRSNGDETCFNMTFCCLSTLFEVKVKVKVQVQGQRLSSRCHFSTGALPGLLKSF